MKKKIGDRINEDKKWSYLKKGLVGVALFLTILSVYNKINHDNEVLSASQRRFDTDFSTIKQHLTRVKSESKTNNTNTYKITNIFASNYSKANFDSKLKIQLQLHWYSQLHGLDTELVNNVAYVESNWKFSAVSSDGAVGIMQIMPETALRYGLNNIYNIKAYMNIYKKFKDGILPYSELKSFRIKYAESLKNEIKGKTFEELILIDDRLNPEKNIDLGTRYLRDLLIKYRNNKKLALAAYNAGEDAVSQYNGVPPFPETVTYIYKIQQLE